MRKGFYRKSATEEKSSGCIDRSLEANLLAPLDRVSIQPGEYPIRFGAFGWASLVISVWLAITTASAMTVEEFKEHVKNHQNIEAVRFSRIFHAGRPGDGHRSGPATMADVVFYSTTNHYFARRAANAILMREIQTPDDWQQTNVNFGPFHAGYSGTNGWQIANNILHLWKSELPCESIDIPANKPTFAILAAAKTFLDELYSFGTLLPLDKADFPGDASFKGLTKDGTVFRGRLIVVPGGTSVVGVQFGFANEESSERLVEFAFGEDEAFPIHIRHWLINKRKRGEMVPLLGLDIHQWDVSTTDLADEDFSYRPYTNHVQAVWDHRADGIYYRLANGNLVKFPEVNPLALRYSGRILLLLAFVTVNAFGLFLVWRGRFSRDRVQADSRHR